MATATAGRVRIEAMRAYPPHAVGSEVSGGRGVLPHSGLPTLKAQGGGASSP